MLTKNALKIDAYPHILPPKYLEALERKATTRTFTSKFVRDLVPAMYDLDARFRIMDRYEGYVQILNVTQPPVETIVGPAAAAELARLANDELAELVAKYPDRFVAAVACLPMNDVEAALRELDRAITELHFRGVQIYTTIADKPLDLPEFEPLFERMHHYGLPILLHPRSMLSGPRAFGRKQPEEELEHLAQAAFNWPFETTIAMGRLVFSGLLDKFPNLKILTHHCGGLVPYEANRISAGLDLAKVGFGRIPSLALARDPLEHYRMMYGDTATCGNTAALMCGRAFFGADHLLLGTDMPWDTEGGERYVRETLRAVEEMDIPATDRQKIFADNAKRIFQLN